MRNRAIGIDLGTTNSCVAIMGDSKPEIVQSNLGYSTIPSIVTLDDMGEPIVGQAAERRMTLHANETVYGSKRLLGRTFLAGARKRYQPHFRYRLVADNDGFIAARIKDRTLRLVEVSSMILSELKKAAESAMNETFDRAVITVPAYFNENQRALVRQAGDLAGLKVLRIINEPTAAALCFGRHLETEAKLLVFDVGGGTFDVSIIHVKDNVFTVLGVDGNTFLGGLDFDRKISDWLASKVLKSQADRKTLDPVSRERLRKAAQEAKHQLSASQVTTINIPNFQFPDGSTVNVQERLTREQLEELTSELVQLMFSVVERALKRADLTPAQIDEILLVGGQSRMPAIHRGLTTLFGKEPSQRLHPDEVVALGAAIAAHSYDHGGGAELRDVTPLSIGLAARGGKFVPLVRRNTPLPHEASAQISIRAGATSIKLAVFQGEKKDVVNNEFLGTLHVEGFSPSSSVSTCHVVFQLNEEGLLTVRAHSPELAFDKSVTLETTETTADIMMGLGAEKIDLPPAPSLPPSRTSKAPKVPQRSPTSLSPAAPPPSLKAPPTQSMPPVAAVPKEQPGILQRLFGWMR